MNWQPSTSPCSLCGRQDEFEAMPDGYNRRWYFKCPRCGIYELKESYIVRHRGEAPRPLLSGLARDYTDRSMPNLVISYDNAADLEKLAPSSVEGKLFALLRAIARLSGSPGKHVSLGSDDYPLAYAQDYEELIEYLNYSEGRGFLSTFEVDSEGAGVVLSIPGWAKLEAAQKPNSESDRAFVAMWFDSEMTSAYNEAIAPAIEAAGYESIRIDRKNHNNKIDDEIIAEIEQSRFLVADFTARAGRRLASRPASPRASASKSYGRAGQDAIDDLHFDTRQYAHIVWTTADELREALKLRILATVGKGPRGS